MRMYSLPVNSGSVSFLKDFTFRGPWKTKLQCTVVFEFMLSKLCLKLNCLYTGRLLRTLSRDGSKRSADFLTSATSTTKLIDNTSTSSSSLYQSDESNRAENSGANRISSFTSSSISYDENMVDLGSCSEGGSHTRPNSICKFKSDSSSENDVDSDDFMKCDLEHQNGNLNSKVGCIVFSDPSIDVWKWNFGCRLFYLFSIYTYFL